MSVLLSKATGNFLTAGTWALVDATSYSNSETTNAVPSVSAGAGTRSSTFTPGAITIDAIAIKLASLTNTTGTITVNLFNSTDGVDVTGATATINKSDLPTCATATLDGGWIVFKFSGSVTLVAGKAYAVQIVVSNSTGILVFVTAGTNWSRALRTTTTQAPVAGDDMIVAGEHTGAGTGNSFVVTMDETAATDYGSNTTSAVTPALAICKRGTLKFKDISAANPYLRASGHVIVYNGGELDQGTTGTPIPRDSTAISEFDCAADGDFGLIVRNGGTWTSQGLSRTSGKTVVAARLVADTSVNLMQAITLSASAITATAATTTLDPTGTSLGGSSVAAGQFNQLIGCVDTVANSNHKVTWTGLVSVTNTTQVYTQWVKRGSGTNNRYVRLQLATATALPATNGFYADFDLQAGTVGTCTALGNGTATSAAITAFGGGYICTIIGKISSGASTPVACIGACNASGVVSYAGDATQNFICSWPQVYTASAQPTDLTIDTDTGWKSGDVVAVASTTRTAAECEVVKLGSDAGASTLTLSLYPTNFHSGSGDVPNTVTLTIASPCVVTGNKDAVNGAKVVLTTTGALPTGLTASTAYYVVGKASDGTHQLAATPGGAAINTSGSQSGVHTATTSCTQAEVILLSRNVKVRSSLNTAMTFVQICDGAIVDVDWTEFYYVGVNAVGKRGVEILNLGSSAFNVSIQFSSIHDAEQVGFYIGSISTNLITSLVFSNNALWNLATAAGPACTTSAAFNATNYTIDSNILIRTGSGNGWTLADVGGTFTNNTVVGAAAFGISLAEANVIGTMSGNVAHSNTSINIAMSANGLSGTFTLPTFWRSAAQGLSFASAMIDFVLDGPIGFGNATSDILMNVSATNVHIKNPVLNGDSSFATTTGIQLNAIGTNDILVDNADMSTASGIKVAHSGNDINVAAVSDTKMVLRNPKLGAATQVATTTNLSNNGYVGAEKLGQVSGAHKTWMKNGSVATDTVVYNTASPSMVMTPQSSYGPFSGFAVTSGSPTITPTAANLVIFASIVAVGDLIVGASAAFPPGTYVSAMNPSAGTITASANAGATVANDSLSFCKKLQSAPLFESIKAAVASGSTLTAAVYVRKRAENLFTYSEDYSQAAWSVNAATATTGQTDPLSGTAATKYLETVSNTAAHGLQRNTNVTIVSGATYTYTTYIKPIGRQWFRFRENSRDSWFDLTNGVAGTVNAAHTVSVTASANGFYKVVVVVVANSASFSPQINTATADNSAAAFAGDVTKGYTTWGWQIENGSVASPYQITTATNQPGYNGQQPRLIVRANPAVGIMADTVLATYSAGNGAWNQISGATAAVTDDGVLEFIVDCDGTTGAINVDDWSFS